MSINGMEDQVLPIIWRFIWIQRRKKIGEFEFSGFGGVSFCRQKTIYATVRQRSSLMKDGDCITCILWARKKDEVQDVPVASWYIRLFNR